MRPRTQQVLTALAWNKPSDLGVRTGQEDGRNKWQHVSKSSNACYPVLGPRIWVSRGGGRDRVASGHVKGQGSPWVSRKVLGPLQQELSGPPQLLQAGSGCDISLELLLLTGGAGVCTGRGGQSGPGKGVSERPSQDLPRGPVPWF